MRKSHKTIWLQIFSITLIWSLIFISVVSTQADEGMWMFGNPPLKQLKEKYNFEPSKEWIDHLRLSATRLNNGGSGAFVSANGLVITNHHVARSLIAKLSTAEKDLLKSGFYAPTYNDELRCPDLEINVLVSLEDVTKQVQSAAQPASDNAEAEKLRRAEIAKIEKTSAEMTKLRSDVVNLYEGGEYWLYRYKKYTDIRLVFAPEAQAAEFGGDYDNFTYPRYALDFAFLRVYENDKPVKPEHYLHWNSNAPKDNELIFVVGNPGNTDRLRTISQLEYQRDYLNVIQLKSLTRRRDALVRYSKNGAEQARRASDTISSLENGLKRLNGQQEGLVGNKIMQQKINDEKDLRDKVAANPELQKLYGDAWDQMTEAYKRMSAMAKRTFYSSLGGSNLGGFATTLAQYAVEVHKPNSERKAAYRESSLESLKFQLLSPAPIYLDFEEVLLADRLQELQDELGKDDPFVKAALNGRTAQEVATDVIKHTKLTDVAFRKALFDGGADAIEKSDDPLVVMARRIVPVINDLDRWSKENFEGLRASAGERVAKARFAVYGRSSAPDANFTVRFSYGQVKGYEVGTTLVPYKTTFAGLFDRGESFDYQAPFNIAPRILAAREKLDQTKTVDFVYTADTIGGNSGSPVINKNGEIIGVNFDSNIHRFVSRYVYTEERGRAMAVHTAGMVEVMRKVYNAGSLADELEGRK